MPYVWPVAMLVVSNVFMTVAWYGHLKYKSSPLWIAIAASWGIALVEYCFQVPANRLGSAVYSLAQLKAIQEIITLTVFSGFVLVVFPEQSLRWNHAVGFVLLVGAAFFLFQKQA